MTDDDACPDCGGKKHPARKSYGPLDNPVDRAHTRDMLTTRIACDECGKDLGVATGVTLRDVNKARKNGQPVICSHCHEVDEINNGPGSEDNIDPFEMSKAIHD